MCEWPECLLSEAITSEAARSVLGSLGVISSILTFAITTIMARPAMVRWRSTGWRILALWWIAVVLCLLEVLLPDGSGSVRSLPLKIGITLWGAGLIRLLILIRQILFIHRSALSKLGRHAHLERFQLPEAGELGPPFINSWAGTLASFGKRLRFPLLLAADREAHGLDVVQIFVAAGLRRDAGTVYLTFTRPAETIARQVLRHLDLQQTDWESLEKRVRIIDCYSELFHQEQVDDLATTLSVEPRVIDHFLAACVKRCDPRDPIALQTVYKQALRDMQQRCVTQVRVVYDSLSDFLGVADSELVVSYLRHMVVFEEHSRILAVYLIWPEVLQEPISDKYLSWFFTTVVRMRNEDGRVSAELENISEIAGRRMIDPRLDFEDRGFEIDRTRVDQLAYAVRTLEYRAVDMTDWSLFPAPDDRGRDADFLFFLTAIDHHTVRPGAADTYEEEVDGRLLSGSDLMYAKATKRQEQDPGIFSAKRLQAISEDAVASWFRLESGADIADPGLRAYLLRDAAQRLIEQYEGDAQSLLSACVSQLDNKQHGGLLQRLAEFRAYEDPLRKKSHLLSKILIRRGIWVPRDAHKQEVPVDPVLVHLALRSGLVTVTESGITQRILSGQRLSQDVARRLRLLTLRGFGMVSERSGLAPYELDDLLWGFGRVFLRSGREVSLEDLKDNPYVKGVAHPDAVARFLAVLGGTQQPGAPLTGRDIKPLFPETWYY